MTWKEAQVEQLGRLTQKRAGMSMLGNLIHRQGQAMSRGEVIGPRLAIVIALWTALLLAPTPAVGQDRLDKGWAHASTVTAVAFSPDSSVLASTDGSTVKLWEVATGRLLHKLNDSAGAVSLAFSADSSRVAVGGGGIRCWDVGSGRLFQRLNDASSCEVVFGTDRDTLFSGPKGLRIGGLLRWDLRQGTARSPIDGAGNLTREQWSVGPGGRWVAVTPDARQIIIYDSQTESIVSRLTDLPGPLAIKFTKTSLLAAWGPGRVALYSPESKSYRLNSRVQGTVNNLEASPDGRLVAIDQSGKVLFVTVSEVKTVARYEYSEGEHQMALTSDGLVSLLMTQESSHLKLIDCKSGSGAWLAWLFSANFGEGLDGHVSTMAISPDGRLLATGHKKNGISKPMARLWELERTRQAANFPSRAGSQSGFWNGRPGETLQSVFARRLPGMSCTQGPAFSRGASTTGYRLLVNGQPSNLSGSFFKNRTWAITSGAAPFQPYQFQTPNKGGTRR